MDDPCDGEPKSTLPTKLCVTYAPNLIVGLFGPVLLVERANLKVTMHNFSCGSWDAVVRVNVPSFWSQDAILLVNLDLQLPSSESVDVVIVPDPIRFPINTVFPISIVCIGSKSSSSVIEFGSFLSVAASAIKSLKAPTFNTALSEVFFDGGWPLTSRLG